MAASASAAALVLLVWGSLVRHATVRRVVVAPARRWPTRLPRRRVDHDLAPVLDELGRRVRAGGSLTDALTAVCGPTAPPPLLAAVERHRRGLALSDACRPVADVADPSLALVGATLCAVARFGGAGGRALDTAAAALRERAALVAEVNAQAATARLSGVVLAVLPLGFGGWTVATDAAARHFLAATPLGWAVAATGLALDGVGAWWMRRLVRAAGAP